MAKGDDIEERLINFAVRIVNLCSQLPRTVAGRHIAGQLLRSGTSPAANYAEARNAESLNDFVHKLKLVAKELQESRIGLRSFSVANCCPQDDCNPFRLNVTNSAASSTPASKPAANVTKINHSLFIICYFP